MWTRTDLKDNAKKALARCYWPAVLVSLIFTILGGSGSIGYRFSSSSSSADLTEGIRSFQTNDLSFIIPLLVTIIAASIVFLIIGFALAIFIINPLYIGEHRFFIMNGLENHKAPISVLSFGFKDGRYMNAVKTIFLKDLFQWLWSLLLIIPGIIKGYEYRMIPSLLAENPEMDYQTAFALSKKMMTGEKMNAFILDLSFLGWLLLSLVTCGLLSILYVAPYINFTNAQLYLTLRGKLEKEGLLTQYGLTGFDAV